MKKDAQLPALDEEAPLDAAALTGETNEDYFEAGNTEGDDSGLSLDSIRMDVVAVRF